MTIAYAITELEYNQIKSMLDPGDTQIKSMQMSLRVAVGWLCFIDHDFVGISCRNSCGHTLPKQMRPGSP